MTDNVVRWRVRCQRSVEYDVVNAPHLFHPQNPALLSLGRVDNGRRFVVVDANVARDHATEIQAYFAHHGVNAKIAIFPGGEENKTLGMYLEILHELDVFPIHRRDEPIIVIGGGVLTDVVGFAASNYRRGVPHIKVPTTLMGYVDASVGIKSAINFNGHKNRLGSFEPPRRVLLDRAFLKTLSRRHLLNGVCEIIKLAIIKDAELFCALESAGTESVAAHFQNPSGGEILDCAISGMLEELQSNLFEDNLSRKVDFGHTFSHALESRHTPHLLHGEAVLLDIAVSILIARNRKLLSEQETARVFSLIDRLGMVLSTDSLDSNLLWQSLLERIENRNGLQRVPIPDAIGHCVFLNDIERLEIETSVRTLKEWGRVPYAAATQR